MDDTFTFDSIAALIRLWPEPCRTSFASDLGVSYGNVQQFERRNSLPPEYWDDVVTSATARGISGVSLTALARFAKKRRRGNHGGTDVGQRATE